MIGITVVAILGVLAIGGLVFAVYDRKQLHKKGLL